MKKARLREPFADRRPLFDPYSNSELAASDLTATLLDLRDADWSLSITARQPGLRLDLFLIMQAVIFGMFGISEAQRRNASPVHICCASEEKACPAEEERTETETVKASIKPIWRMVRVKVIASPSRFGQPIGRC